MRQRDANLTALAAIGPRKKRKVDSPGPGSGTEVRSAAVLEGAWGPGAPLGSALQVGRHTRGPAFLHLRAALPWSICMTFTSACRGDAVSWRFCPRGGLLAGVGCREVGPPAEGARADSVGRAAWSSMCDAGLEEGKGPLRISVCPILLVSCFVRCDIFT